MDNENEIMEEEEHMSEEGCESPGDLTVLVKDSAVRTVAGDLVMLKDSAALSATADWVQMEGSAAMVVQAEMVDANNSTIFLALTQKLGGECRPVFTPLTAAAFGAAFGGAIILFSLLFRRRRD